MCNIKRKLFVLILFIVCICCAVRFLGNKNSNTAGQKVVLLIDGSEKTNCTEIILEDCRDDYVDYCKGTGTIVYINTENQIVEINISGEKNAIIIEGIDLSEKISNVQYGLSPEEINFIYNDEIYQYSLMDKWLTKKTDGIESSWRKTYLWTDEECVYKIMDDDALHYIDTNNGSIQEVCGRWIRSIGQIQGNKMYALELYVKSHNEAALNFTDRIIEIDLSDGSMKPIQELGNWMEGNYMFACNEGNLYYVKKKGEKRNIYRMDLSTGNKKKIYSTRNTVVGFAWTT